jgi:guanylate kinase
MHVQRHPFITLTGPSGSGKTTVVRALQAQGFLEAVSTTTRAPRAGETQGLDYDFVSQERFQELVDADEFLEIVEFSGNRYGITRSEIADKTCLGPTLIVVDGCGAEQILDRYGDPNGLCRIYLDVSKSTVFARMAERGDDRDQINQRLDHDRVFEAWKHGIDWDLLIHNKVLGQTVRTIQAFTLEGTAVVY